MPFCLGKRCDSRPLAPQTADGRDAFLCKGARKCERCRRGKDHARVHGNCDKLVKYPHELVAHHCIAVQKMVQQARLLEEGGASD